MTISGTVQYANTRNNHTVRGGTDYYYRIYRSKKSPSTYTWVKKWDQKKFRTNFFHVTIAYSLKEKSKIKDTFSRKFLPRNKKKLIFCSKMGGWLIHGIDLYPAKYSIPLWKFGFMTQVDRGWITKERFGELMFQLSVLG